MPKALPVVACFFVLFGFVSAGRGQESELDPLKLFLKMEMQLQGARSFRVKGSIRLDGEAKEECKGSLVAEAATGRLKYEMTGKSGGANVDRGIVCNGGKLQSRGYDSGTVWKEEPSARISGSNLTAGFVRLGLRDSLDLGGSIRGGYDVERLSRIRDVVLLRREEKNGAMVSVVEVSVEFRRPETVVIRKSTVWIDEKSLLPLRRSSSLSGELDVSLTETYDEVALNVDIQPADFQLPGSK